MPEQKEFISIDGIAMSARAIFMPSNNYNGGCFMDSNDLKFVESRIDYKFKNTDLLQQAFIRRSYSKECGGENNEVLEFIGDKVLDMVVVKWLISQNGFFCSQTKEFNRNNDWDEFCSKRDEHQLTQDKKWLVCKETLAERIDIMGLAKFLIMGKGDSKNNIQNQNYKVNNNMVINEGNEEIINEQKKEIQRLNNLLKQRELEISNLNDEKNKMQEYIEELEQKINGFLELDKAKE